MITIERKKLEQVLKALENHEGNYKLGKAGCDRQEAAITDIKEALPQPAQGTVSDLLRDFAEQYIKEDEAVESFINRLMTLGRKMADAILATPPAAQPAQPFLPVQRPWVGLEAEDRLCAKYMQDAPEGIEAVVEYIEAKLKAVNGFLKEKNT
jgi:hypothetical protein